MKIPLLLMLILSASFRSGAVDIDRSAAIRPDLIILNPNRSPDVPDLSFYDDLGANINAGMDINADGGNVSSARTVVADSALFVSPPVRTVITGGSVVYEIEPMLTVDSVLLFVRHSQNEIDTLGVVASPPYSAVWESGRVSDQDPVHLQFGYTLYCPDLLTVVSPPRPHLWTLRRDRTERGRRALSPERYRVRQMGGSPGARFALDGDRSKWHGAQTGRLGSPELYAGEFRMLWTSARLYFGVWVNDSSVTPGDFVELHLDMARSRADFPDMNHRTFRFGPLTRSMSFVGDFIDGRYVPNDSVSYLLSEEMIWRTAMNPDRRGYVIEAVMPFSLLSGFDLPPPRIGFDVTVMNVDRVVRRGSVADLFGDSLRVMPIGATFGRIEYDTAFYSWAGGGRFTRYSPSSWGTARFNQATFMFKLMFYFVLFLFCASPPLIIMQAILGRRKEAVEDRAMEDDFSPLTEAVIEAIEEELTDANFGISDAATSVGKTEEEIAAALAKDMDSTFDRLLTFRRIKRSQGLMRNVELSIDDIAERCGFPDVGTYRERYKAQMSVNPEVSREALLDRIREEREEDEEDDD